MLSNTHRNHLTAAHERTHNGCFTCRLRSKKCNVEIPVDQNIKHEPCRNCQRLGLECMGYGKGFPGWMQDRSDLKQKIKKRLTLTGHIKGRKTLGSANNDMLSTVGGVLRLSPPYITTPSFPASGPDTTSTMDYSREDVQILALGSALSEVSLSISDDQQTSTNIESQSLQLMADKDIVHYSERHLGEDIAIPHNSLVTWRVYPDPKMFLLKVYYQHVFSRAYMLVHPNMIHHISSIIDTDIFAQNSICLLASTFLIQTGRSQDVPIAYRQNVMEYLSAYESFLLSNNRQVSRGEALGALQLISNSLFADGAHPWRHYLNIAFIYVHPLIHNTPVCDLDPPTLFIAQITGWFCVLAAISNDFRPDCLKTFVALFDVGNYVNDHAERYMNMSAIMGADCRVLWALAEITDLAQTKHTLSAEMVRERGQKILQRLRNSQVTKPDGNANPTGIHDQRWATGELFRLSALLYYYAVIHDNNPDNADISSCVDIMLDLILSIGSSSITSRMCVFGIFLCGALCRFIQVPTLERFLLQASTDNVGNSRAVLGLLLEIWCERYSSRNPCCNNVNWRDPLKRKQLLLV